MTFLIGDEVAYVAEGNAHIPKNCRGVVRALFVDGGVNVEFPHGLYGVEGRYLQLISTDKRDARVPLEGIKHDQDKAPLWWVPFPMMEGVARVMEYGARKYTAHNWRKGMKWTRLLSAALRHLMAWASGQNKDPETGYSHLAHAACCIAFLMTYETEGLGEDDRGFK